MKSVANMGADEKEEEESKEHDGDSVANKVKPKAQ